MQRLNIALPTGCTSLATPPHSLDSEVRRVSAALLPIRSSNMVRWDCWSRHKSLRVSHSSPDMGAEPTMQSSETASVRRAPASRTRLHMYPPGAAMLHPTVSPPAGGLPPSGLSATRLLRAIVRYPPPPARTLHPAIDDLRAFSGVCCVCRPLPEDADPRSVTGVRRVHTSPIQC